MYFQIGQRVCYRLSNSIKNPNDEKQDFIDPKKYNLQHSCTRLVPLEMSLHQVTMLEGFSILTGLIYLVLNYKEIEVIFSPPQT